MMKLTTQQQELYARQIQLEGFGERGQLRLSHGAVFVCGIVPGVAACARYLAASGLGRLYLPHDLDPHTIDPIERRFRHMRLGDTRIVYLDEAAHYAGFGSRGAAWFPRGLLGEGEGEAALSALVVIDEAESRAKIDGVATVGAEFQALLRRVPQIVCCADTGADSAVCRAAARLEAGLLGAHRALLHVAGVRSAV